MSIENRARPLTAKEVAAAQTIFGNLLNYSEIKIKTSTDLGPFGQVITGFGYAAVTLGNTIYFPNKKNTQESLYHFETSASWFIHEMTHVFQYHTLGISYAFCSVWEQVTKSETAYQPIVEKDKPFDEYGIEQQAVLVQRYYDKTFPEPELGYVTEILKKKGLLF